MSQGFLKGLDNDLEAPIARRHPDQEEVQDDERKKDDDGLRDPLGDEGNHVLSIALEVRYPGVRLGD